jgi:hypothetical protein
MTRQRREGEANGPQGQRPTRASRTGASWAEFVRLAHQAVVAFEGAGTTNRAEPRACGHHRGPRCLDSEPGSERTARAASNGAGNGLGRAQHRSAGASNRIGENSLYGMIRGGGGTVRHDLLAICHDARKGRYIGSQRSKPGAPPLYSTSLMSPCCSVSFLFMASVRGPIEVPSPMISSATPRRMSLCDRPSSISARLAQLSMLMNPGATAIPCASSSTRPCSLGNGPIAAMLCPVTARSPANGGLPLPSYRPH